MSEKNTQPKDEGRVYIDCPGCQTKYKIRISQSNKKLKCKKCTLVFDCGQIDFSENVLPAKSKKNQTLNDFLKSNKLTIHSDLNIDNQHDFSEDLSHNLEDRYNVGEAIAEGGMGKIYSTKDLNIKRTIVTKVLKVTKNIRDIYQFIEEAQICGQLEHPNIVPVHDLGINDKGQIFFTMKLVKGLTLHEILEKLASGDPEIQQKYSLNHLLEILQKVCDAIDYAHNHKVIHRDLKPHNIMVGEFGEVLVMDWGLAKILGHAEEDAEEINESEVAITSIKSGTTSLMTIQGRIRGTPQYMAPEQAKGKNNETDARTDIYSLGVLLHLFISKGNPFEGDTVVEILSNVTRGKVKPANEDAPKELIAVAKKAMSIEQSKRYKNVAAFSDELENFIHGYSVSAKRDTPIEAAKKFIKRNKGLALSVLAVASSLILGVVFTSFMYLKAVKNKEESDLNYVTAQKHLKFSKENEEIALREKKIAQLALEKFEVERDRRLADRKKSAPQFLAKAQALVDKNYIEEAIKNVNTALEYDSKLYNALLLKSQLEICKKNYTVAIVNLEKYIKSPSVGHIEKTNGKILLELCKKIKNDNATLEQSSEFQNIFYHQEQFALAIKLASNSKDLLNIYKGQINLNYKPYGWSFRHVKEGNLITIKFGSRRKEITTIDPLKGIPITNLYLGTTSVKDFTALKNFPLVFLDISSTSIKDLSSLRNTKNLKTLNVSNTNITSIKPIIHLPIELLNIFGCEKIKDLYLLKEMKNLKEICLPEAIAKHVLVLKKIKTLKKAGIASDFDKIGSLYNFLSPKKSIDTKPVKKQKLK